MTDARRARLDAIADEFGASPMSVYLLAGEVPGAVTYDATADETYRRRERVGWGGRGDGYDIEPRGSLLLDY